MASSTRIGTAITAIGMIGMISGCATPGAMGANRSSFAAKNLDNSNIGLASRAMAALEKGDHATAIEFAERAVEYKPEDAVFRTLLGNAYFAAGRFASAETTYRDSLSLGGNQAQVVLKLVLVSIAQGKNQQAIEILQSSGGAMDAADRGLALALAGNPQDAAFELDRAAREVNADARVRQNLALAHALAGDWEMARIVAGQDLSPDQLDSRIQQWMAFAKPAKASDQVAALTGVTPATGDPGQPIRLALNREGPRYAENTAVETPVAPQAPTYVEAPAEYSPPAPVVTEAAPAPVQAAAMPVETAPQPVVAETATVEVSVPAVAIAAAMPTYIPAAPVIAEAAAPAPELSHQASIGTNRKLRLEKAAMQEIKSGGPVVQLGAFSNRANVETAWAKFSARHPSLRNYSPTTARFDNDGTTVYRLSVAGFGSSREAQRYCSTLKSKGGNCFVRSSASDQTVRIALR